MCVFCFQSSTTSLDVPPPSRKRTIDDIFGDIDDIELEEAAERHLFSGI